MRRPHLHYVLSERIVSEAFQILLPAERMVLATVPLASDSQVVVPQWLYEVPYKSRSRYGVEADTAEVNLRIAELRRKYQQRTVGVWHSHPGDRRAGVTPSSIDREAQYDYESIGPRGALTLIFNRSGWIRSLSINIPYTIHIAGHGIIRSRRHRRTLYAALSLVGGSVSPGRNQTSREALSAL